MQAEKQQGRGFWQTYFADKKSIITLVIVCSLIAIFTNAMNRLGILQNMVFSYCYGFPISLIETYIRMRKNPPTEWKINLISIFLGSLFGTIVVYSYLLKHGIVVAGDINALLLVNFGFGLTVSAAAFYFFWTQYRNQSLTLALREQQLKVSESENLQRQAENQLLQSQMEPHFLFNTLANVQSLIDVDPRAAKTMLSNLSAMLRASLNNSAQTFCSVQHELNLVTAYQEIQSVRMGDRVVFKQDISNDLLSLNIVPMVLQPIIENSIRHGVERSVGQCTVSISAQRKDNYIHWAIEDDCQPKGQACQSTGLSLNNIQKRLTNIYHGRASINSGALERGWRTVLIVPIESKDET